MLQLANHCNIALNKEMLAILTTSIGCNTTCKASTSARILPGTHIIFKGI